MMGKPPKILVTAGPTYEYLDPVRFLGNPASGKMGLAIARQAQKIGCPVLLILGPTPVRPRGVPTLSVVSAREMFRAVRKNFRKFDCLVMTAAVSDFRPRFAHPRKMKRGEWRARLELRANPDILAWAARHKGRRVLVGFAAETGDVVKNAKAKLARKRLDFIVANRVSRSGSGFGSDLIEFAILRNGESPEPLRIWTKRRLARELIHKILRVMKP